jgi:hypothetical protein
MWMAYVYVVYGAAFVVMGTAIAAMPKADTGLRLGPHLWSLAAFGILHGISEWIDLLLLVGAGGEQVLAALSAPVLAASFVLLAWFGAAGLAHRQPAWKFVPAILTLAWGVGCFVTGLSHELATILARYLLGLPAAWIAAGAVWLSALEHGSSQWPSRPRLGLMIGAGTLVVYGLATGLVVPRADFLLASVVSQEAFQGLFGFPIQILRAACAVLIAGNMLAVLWLLRWEAETERRRLLSELEEHREHLAQLADQRARELVVARDHLEHISHLLPVCAWCKKIRNDDGYWQKLEAFMNESAHVVVTHSICPECEERRFGDRPGGRPRDD